MSEVDIDYFLPKSSTPIKKFDMERSQLPVTIVDQAHSRDSDISKQNVSQVMVTMPFILRGVTIKDLETRSNLLRAIDSNIPLNEFNLFEFIFRSDLIDCELIKKSFETGDFTETNQMLDNARVEVSYIQGYPSIHNDKPVWAKFEHETQEAYDGFVYYLQLPGVRQLLDIVHLPVELSSNWSYLNFWRFRATAYDIYQTAHAARLREQRILKIGDSHFIEAEKIFNRLVNAVGTKSNEELEKESVEKLVSALDKVSKIQRAALGISSNEKSEERHKNTSIELIMREQSEKIGRKINSDDESSIIDLLQDEETIKQAQELILRVSK